ncbi:MAG: hypothetical protein HY943_16995 [Gammaproteobacteria bacterium]|nr:hypothetical protein [Gammaproteobacteria bacterium]
MGIASATDADAAAVNHPYPRIMGMNIAAPTKYAIPAVEKELSRADVLILGFYRGWESDRKQSMSSVVSAIKRLNSKILIGQYTILQESQAEGPNGDKAAELTKNGWWLKNASGKRVQWTSQYGAWDVNLTHWTQPNGAGQRYPEWLAKRDFETFFRKVPQLDIWYFDNVLSKPAVKKADWKGLGREQNANDADVAKAYREGQVREWKAASDLKPGVLLIGNSDDISSPEYSGRLNGVFLEGLMGVSWSTERKAGWAGVMDRYHAGMQQTAAPHIVGFNVWGKKDDYRAMRYGLTSCLMDNGYFSYTDEAVGYRSLPWFDEYDVALGNPKDPVQTKPASNGIFKREFQNGLVLVNPNSDERTIELPAGFRHINGRQAPQVNNGQPATTVRLKSHDGVILLRQ